MKNKLCLTLIVHLSLLFISADLPVEIAFAQQIRFEKTQVRLISKTGKMEITAEIADKGAKRGQGLMYRKSLDRKAGMLFIFEEERVRYFWMKNTFIPLDIIFVSNKLKILHIISDVPPCSASPCDYYSSIYPIKYAVEVNAGICDKIGLNVGDYIEING